MWALLLFSVILFLRLTEDFFSLLSVFCGAAVIRHVDFALFLLCTPFPPGGDRFPSRRRGSISKYVPPSRSVLSSQLEIFSLLFGS